MNLLTRESSFLIYNLYAHLFYIFVKIIRCIWTPNEKYQLVYKVAQKPLILDNTPNEMPTNLFSYLAVNRGFSSYFPILLRLQSLFP